MQNWTPPALDSDRSLRQHQSRERWHDAIRAIGRAHGIDATQAKPFATGSDVVWGTDEHVVKLTAPTWTAEIEAEARHLTRLSGRLSVDTPEVLGTGALAGWPYIVMSRVVGRPLGTVWPYLDRTERERMSRSLGSLVKELHSLDPVSEEDMETWRVFELECVDMRRRRTSLQAASALACQVEPFLERSIPTDRQPAAFLHTELLDQHILVERENGRFEVCALIDFADGRPGPVPYEFPALVEFVFKGEPGLLRSFLLSYGYESDDLCPRLSQELLAWGLRHRFASLSRMLEAIKPTEIATLEQLAHALYGVVEEGPRGPGPTFVEPSNLGGV